MRLTAKERILIHLAEFAKYAETAEVPPEMGQEGVARAAGIYLQHVRQFLDPLLKEGLVRERTAHVKGHRRRLKVYDPTDSGRLAAARLREQLHAERIRVRDGHGERDTTIGDLLREVGGKLPLASLVQALGEGEIVDLPSVEARRTTGFLARLTEAPRLESFVGREAELDALIRDEGGPRVFVVRGVAGIGKSSLAAKACDTLKASWNVYWHRIRPWDSRPSILAGLGDFLAAIGRPGLHAVLGRGEGDKADRVLAADLHGARCVLVFDDVHQATSEVIGFLQFLKDAIAEAPETRSILISRRTTPFYDRRDVAVRKLVQEIDLTGLDREEIAALLPADLAGARLATIARKLGGHPLFIELLRSSAPRGIGTTSLTDIRKFIEEEIYSDLSDGERRMMKVAALYAVPFPREALFVEPALSHDTFLSLSTKSLIRPVGDDAFEVHDTIRDFFASILTPAERQALGSGAVSELVHRAEAATAAKDLVLALNCLSNALELAPSGDARAGLSETLGDTYEKLGDLPASLAAFADALRHRTDPESVARLHRKSGWALLIRGKPASREIEAAFHALGERPSAERGWLHLLEARAASGQEEWAEAREHGEDALASFFASGDTEGQAAALLELAGAEIYSPRGDPAEAERHLLSALDLAKSSGEPDFEARVHVSLANVYAYRIGNVERATHHIDAVRSLEPSITDPHVLRATLMLRGWFALYQQADFDAAEGYFVSAASLSRKIHDPRTGVYANGGRAQALFFRGEFEKARDGMREFAEDIRWVAIPGEEVEALWSIAEASLLLEDQEGFRRVIAQVRDPRLVEGVATRPLHANVLEGLDALIRGDPDVARGAFDEAVRVAETSYQAGEASPTGFVHFFYGVALQAMDRSSEGTEHVQRSREVLKQSGLRAQLEATVRDESRLVAYLCRLFRAAGMSRR